MRSLAAQWRAEAEAITLSLWQNYSTRETGVPAILLEAARSVPHNWMEHPLIYGDYYFVETLVRLLRPDLESTLFSRQILQVG